MLVSDWATKAAALHYLAGHPRHLVGPLWLRLQLNTGVAFSIGAGHPALAGAVAAGLVVVVALAASRMRSIAAIVGAGLMIGGALGNLADRLLLPLGGAVVDFIWTGLWPTFNLADSAIVAGCALMVLGLSRH